MARPQEQPANFACPNYPFCAIAANAPVPQQYQPHQDLYLAQRQAINQPLVADVPGIAQWYADLHAVSIPIHTVNSTILYYLLYFSTGKNVCY